MPKMGILLFFSFHIENNSYICKRKLTQQFTEKDALIRCVYHMADTADRNGRPHFLAH